MCVYIYIYIKIILNNTYILKNILCCIYRCLLNELLYVEVNAFPKMY